MVDADYHVQTDFLDALVGHFEDPEMGFVQTPHAYRDWHHSRYQRMCAWEYAFFFRTTMRSLNERGAALTVGTMCVIRRRALEDAGGWAEWCLTEDSELAIRIHALGYTSVYLTEVFGRGLIPETFAGYKKQRFRWTYGPVQELKTHLRLFLPGRWGKASRLTRVQRIHHGNHGLDRAHIGVGLALTPVGLAALGSMLAHDERVPVPSTLWVAATILLAATLALRWLTYRVAVGANLADTVGAIVAAAALSHVIAVASLLAVLGRPVTWGRTNKFRAVSRGLGAVEAARTELTLGVTCLGIAIGAIAALPHAGLTVMLAIGLATQGFSFLAAPALAIIADDDVRRAAGASSPQPHPVRRSEPGPRTARRRAGRRPASAPGAGTRARGREAGLAGARCDSPPRRCRGG